MTDEELNKMIGEFLPYPAEGQHYALKQFAKLVAAAEREACALAAEAVVPRHTECGNKIAAAIRARGDALEKLNKAAEDNGEEL
jgi:hypothetical protein